MGNWGVPSRTLSKEPSGMDLPTVYLRDIRQEDFSAPSPQVKGF